MTGTLQQEVPIAIVGAGKIARDQHLRAIEAQPGFKLVATVELNPDRVLPGIPNYPDVASLPEDVRAVAVCTPPHGRIGIVREAVDRGLDILLEKPPAATMAEAGALVAAAAGSGSVLYVSWHSRLAPGVAPARAWLASRSIQRVALTWKEDVRRYHPGQEWIWEPGIGVFDPGINALSILTEILPGPLLLRQARLWFPENREAPVAAELELAGPEGVPVTLAFDCNERIHEAREIEIRTGNGTLKLTDGGRALAIGGQPVDVPGLPEYQALYARFAGLVARRESETDLSPLRLVADAFQLGGHTAAAAFHW